MQKDRRRSRKEKTDKQKQKDRRRGRRTGGGAEGQAEGQKRTDGEAEGQAEGQTKGHTITYVGAEYQTNGKKEQRRVRMTDGGAEVETTIKMSIDGLAKGTRGWWFVEACMDPEVVRVSWARLS
jgi:hypothetical protein